MDTNNPTANTKTNAYGKIMTVDIVPEMEKSYLDYAMSVIVQRALPDVRDGLKPVHRRIIYAMQQMGLTPNGKNVKSAAIVGEVLKSYHPHGDAAVYMSLVRMAQEFSMRYPLVRGQGNFGSIDGDPPAAMRYTEVRMNKITPEMITDINKNTVDTMPNYDDTTTEPVVLPARVPNLLLNGGDGIAVGMATKIPPHNLKEVCQAIDFMLDHTHLESEEEIEINPINNKKKPTTLDTVLAPVYELEKKKYLLETDATVDQLFNYVQGPDFPTGGEIYGRDGIQQMYQTGRGKFTLRGKTTIEETKSGRVRIIIHEIPYQVNKSDLVTKIAQLVKNKKVTGISDLRDESDRRGIRVVIELKKISRPKTILNKLFKYTPLQNSYSANILALVNGVPQTLNLRQILLLFLRHRENVVRRRTLFDLKDIMLRAHILEGLKIALDNIDAIIKTIRASKNTEEARKNLMSKFNLTDLQANAILEMQLRRLAALERQKIEEEYAQAKATIDELTAIITDESKMIKVLKAENKEVTDKYGDSRHTKIYVREIGKFNEEDLIPNTPTLVTLTKTGYIKRVPKETYRTQKRGGIGVVGMTTKEEDEIDSLLSVHTHDELLFFTERGRVFKTKVWEIAESTRKSKGQALVNLINLSQGETVQAVLPLGKDSDGKYILLATRKGTVKKSHINRFKNIRQSGLIAIKLDKGDRLMKAELTTGDCQVFLVTHNGKCIRFNEADIRPMGRHTRGVRGIQLKEDDYLVSMDALPAIAPSKKKRDFRHLLVVAEKGIGKRTNVYAYPLQKRGGVGVKVSNLSAKTGLVATAQVVTQNHHQIILVSKKAVTIRLPLKNVPVLSRNTKGVILMRLKSAEDKVSAMTILEHIKKPTGKK